VESNECVGMSQHAHDFTFEEHCLLFVIKLNKPRAYSLLFTHVN